MRRLSLAVLLLIARAAWAGPFEDGLAAYQQGNYAEAVRWYRQAASQGHANAQLLLGVMYANGIGVPQDYVRAHMWWDLALAAGQDVAGQYRELVATKMTAEQIAEAQKLARECEARELRNCD
jgi:hypothetical protein